MRCTAASTSATYGTRIRALGFTATGGHQDRCRPDCTCRADIAGLVAHHVRIRQVDVVISAAASSRPGAGLRQSQSRTSPYCG